MRAVIEDVFERHMMGTSPEDIELMYRRVYSSGFTQRPDPTVMGAFAGLAMDLQLAVHLLNAFFNAGQSHAGAGGTDGPAQPDGSVAL